VPDTGSLPSPLAVSQTAVAEPAAGPVTRVLSAASLARAWWAGAAESHPGWLDLAWVLLWMLGLAAIIVFGHWEEIPFDLIWISFALVYSFRVRSTGPTLWLLAAMGITTFSAIGVDVLRHSQPADELTAVPLMAAMFWVMMWHGRRRAAANDERIRISEENARLLATQQQFLQDASHQLRTPITIALGHSELLARNLAGNQDKRDISVIVGELNRLRKLSERLLLIAAAANPDFLQPEPVELDQFITDVLWRWQPAADRHWQLGQLDVAVILADAERLGLAVDALLENAIAHTTPDDMIRLAVARNDKDHIAAIVVQDTGPGIPDTEMTRIFERFASGQQVAGRRGTGLGLPLVRAVTEGHGGQVLVHSSPGLGSRFELRLPMPSAPAEPAVQDRPAVLAVRSDAAGTDNCRSSR
jgi:signal transduction histidine kinase